MIRIVTDSTGYVPADIIQTYDIVVVSLKVLFGSETYAEGTGTGSAEFWRRLAESRDFPTTSQPAAGEYRMVFDLLRQANPDTEILVLNVSSKLSGSYNAAKTAAAQLPETAITVFDSRSVALGLGLMVINAARMAAAGQTIPAIMARLEQMRRDTRIVLAVETLEYLRRGGRIGSAMALLGTLLDTKPLLAVVDGEMQPLARVRTKARAMSRLVEEMARCLPRPDQPVEAGVMHMAAEAEMVKLAAVMRDRFNITRLYTAELGPVVGVHVGPGAVGAGLCPAS